MIDAYAPFPLLCWWMTPNLIMAQIMLASLSSDIDRDPAMTPRSTIESTGNRPPLSPADLARQNRQYQGTGGCSAENRECGFAPAFLDARTGRVHRSRFADGRPAPMHLLDGLPPELVQERSPGGRVTAVSTDLVAGFVRNGRFYTRAQAAAALDARTH
ncbi:MAG: hypothetical protein R3202_09580 [Candidatus Competibacterales bacterium]|nr:hypothetical protein [Candidatus Competibacterales bacterium]